MPFETLKDEQMNDNETMGVVLLAIPCWIVSMLAILLIWGAAALGWALLSSVVVLCVTLVIILK